MAFPTNSSSSEPTPAAHLPETSLIKSNACLRPQGPTDKHDYLFVDVQADFSQRIGVGRQKKAFLSRNSHQRRKQASVDRLKYSQSSSSYLSPETYLSQGYVDPFCTFSVPMTDSMNMYLSHYKVHIVPYSYPFNATQMNIWWWQKAIASPALLQTVLFLAAGHKATLQSSNGISPQAIQKSIKDSLYFRIGAIRSLNDLLQDPVTAAEESTVLLVSTIVTIEALNANFEALQAHMKGLKTLICLMGGLDALSHMMLTRIYLSTTAYATLFNSTPAFPMLARFRSEILQESKMFHPGSGEYEFEIPAILASLGTRFARAPWYPELHASMKYLIKVFQRLIRHFEAATLLAHIVMPTDNDLFIVFHYKVLSINYRTESDHLNEPLRLSFLIYLYLRVSNFQRFPIMRHLAETLKSSLACRLSYFQIKAPDLLFWILFIGGIASQGYSCHSWFVVLLTDAAHQLGLQEWNKARPVLGEFFYTDRPGQTGAEDLWNEVLVAGSYPYIAPKPALDVLNLH